MSSAARTTRSATPLLADGMRLTQPEFHRRYEQYPDKIKFELIGGVVYMGSPLFVGHARGDMKLGVVFGTYEARTPGVEAIPNLTHVLGAHSEHQPDLILRILTECGGQSDFAGPGFLRSAPELICENSYTSQRLDLGERMDDFVRFGVREYVVYDAKAKVTHWFKLPTREKLIADRAGVFKSDVFPGLWLDSKALARGDSASLIAAVEKGTKSAAHRRFVERLKAAQRS